MEDLLKNEFYKKKFRHAVEVLDTNRDGTISRADFLKTLQCHKDLGATEEHLKKVKAIFDKFFVTLGLTDDSIKLKYEEFEEIHMRNNSKMKEHDIAAFRELFCLVDIDGDGKISYEEWVRHYKTMFIDVAFARDSFDAMDTNHDGMISMEEFVDYHIEYYYSAEDKLKSSLLYGPMQ